MVQQGMQHQPCHGYKILMTDFAFFKKVDGLHRPIPNILTSMNMFESISPDFATVQTYQIQGTLGVDMFLHGC